MRAAVLAAVCAALCAAQSPETGVIRPGQAWFDTDGNRMYAGGANLYEENGVFYLVGEGNKTMSDCSECFNLYSSKDLQTWSECLPGTGGEPSGVPSQQLSNEAGGVVTSVHFVSSGAGHRLSVSTTL
jgi:hypothetical protein